LKILVTIRQLAPVIEIFVHELALLLTEKPLQFGKEGE